MVSVSAHPKQNTTARRVRAARVRALLTQAELAEAAGVSRSSVVRIENGHQDANDLILERLARALSARGVLVTWQELKGEAVA